ncbi:helicase [Gordonia phage VanLee]|uniref:Helicase n=1 Tax=Gordonia phage VanLee TaxID=2845816 RepID=A0A8F2IFE0_9CAUD|nr:helicase [Gordonia phage VanLee]QWS68193.1 helicase [Gordonia phage VanLee]
MTPEEVHAIAAERGIELTPWQRQAVEVYCAGGLVVWGRRAGQSTLHSLMAEAARRAGITVVGRS